MSERVVYIGRDLEAMSFAVNYHRWIVETFRPYLGARLVEVGAGTGGFSDLLVDEKPKSLSLVEPSAEMHRILADRMHGLRPPPKVQTYNAIFKDVAQEIREAQRPDSIIYVNVMEHVRDDEGEFRVVWETLEPGGRIFVFVPAMPWLYGNFDTAVGHFRRYTKAELEGKCQGAGFKIIKSTYFDLIGVVPWWIQYRLLHAHGLNPRAVKFYDRLVVPVTKAVETLVSPRLGKNLLMVAEKTQV